MCLVGIQYHKTFDVQEGGKEVYLKSGRGFIGGVLFTVDHMYDVRYDACVHRSTFLRF